MANEYSDDDLDDLPLNTLNELESNAIEFTQRQQATHEISSDYGDDLHDDIFDDAVVIDESKTRAIPTIQCSKIVKPPNANEQFRLSRYGPSNDSQPAPTPSLVTSARVQSHGVNRAPGRMLRQNTPTHNNVQTSPSTVNDDGGVDQMRKQIEDLMKEQEQLQQQVTSKTGEIAIVRTNQEKASKEYERQLNALKHSNAEELAKQKKATEIAREAERTAATELEFAKRDLAEEGEKIRNLKKVKNKEQKPGGDQITTPKKNKSLPHGDGFDNDELQIISPSKFQAKKSNPGTPTRAGNKRKRKGVESPIKTLDFEPNPEPAKYEQPQSLIPQTDQAWLAKLSKDDHRLDVSIRKQSDVSSLTTVVSPIYA